MTKKIKKSIVPKINNDTFIIPTINSENDTNVELQHDLKNSLYEMWSKYQKKHGYNSDFETFNTFFLEGGSFLMLISTYFREKNIDEFKTLSPEIITLIGICEFLRIFSELGEKMEFCNLFNEIGKHSFQLVE